MPTYHSVFKQNSYNKACDFPLIPFHNGKKPDLDPKKLKKLDPSIDIVDEAIMYFRANVLFKNFKIQSDADKTIIYLMVFISKCLSSIYDIYTDSKKCKEILNNLIVECSWAESMKSHFLNTILNINQEQIEDLKKYLKTLREETVNRLYYILFQNEGCELYIKYWMGFAKLNFLGYEMPQIKKY